MTVVPCLHFVGFRGDEYARAVRVFGHPDFIHIGWDLRAMREIAAGDTIIFAQADDSKTPSRRSYPDIIEPRLDPRRPDRAP